MDTSRTSPQTSWFVLSIEGDDAGELHGTIESTRGDLHVHFSSGRELLAILTGAGPTDAGSEASDA